jgi:hypothetical protein
MFPDRKHQTRPPHAIYLHTHTDCSVYCSMPTNRPTHTSHHTHTLSLSLHHTQIVHTALINVPYIPCIYYTYHPCHLYILIPTGCITWTSTDSRRENKTCGFWASPKCCTSVSEKSTLYTYIYYTYYILYILYLYIFVCVLRACVYVCMCVCVYVLLTLDV